MQWFTNTLGANLSRGSSDKTAGRSPVRPVARLVLSLSKLLCVTACFIACCQSRCATLTLTWNPVSGTNITYRVYQSINTQPFSLSLSALTANQVSVNYDPTMTMRWYVTAFSAAYQIQESDPSNVWTNSPPPPPLSGLTFEAESGAITAPFYINGTVVQQDTQTGASDGGRASYQFTITNAGTYHVSVMVNAPSGESDSFFVNIDGEPNDATIWDVPVATGIQERKVQWRGETAPHQFALTAAQHVLVFRGREPGAQIDRISIVPVQTTPPPQPIPGSPPAPTGLRGAQVSGTRIDLSWQTALIYSTRIERAPPNGAFTQIGQVGPGNLHYTTSAKKNETWIFRVRACDQFACSPPSNELWWASR